MNIHDRSLKAVVRIVALVVISGCGGIGGPPSPTNEVKTFLMEAFARFGSFEGSDWNSVILSFSNLDDGTRSYGTNRICLKGLEFDFDDESISDADRLNGVKWRGRVRIKAKAYRYSDMSRTNHTEWESGSGPFEALTIRVETKARESRWGSYMESVPFGGPQSFQMQLMESIIEDEERANPRFRYDEPRLFFDVIFRSFGQESLDLNQRKFKFNVGEVISQDTKFRDIAQIAGFGEAIIKGWDGVKGRGQNEIIVQLMSMLYLKDVPQEFLHAYAAHARAWANNDKSQIDSTWEEVRRIARTYGIG